MKITLPKDTRYFTRFGNVLSVSNNVIPRGSVLEIGQLKELSFNGKNRVVAPFLYFGLYYYLLPEETGIPHLLVTLRRQPARW